MLIAVPLTSLIPRNCYAVARVPVTSKSWLQVLSEIRWMKVVAMWKSTHQGKTKSLALVFCGEKNRALLSLLLASRTKSPAKQQLLIKQLQTLHGEGMTVALWNETRVINITAEWAAASETCVCLCSEMPSDLLKLLLGSVAEWPRSILALHNCCIMLMLCVWGWGWVCVWWVCVYVHCYVRPCLSRPLFSVGWLNITKQTKKWSHCKYVSSGSHYLAVHFGFAASTCAVTRTYTHTQNPSVNPVTSMLGSLGAASTSACERWIISGLESPPAPIHRKTTAVCVHKRENKSIHARLNVLLWLSLSFPFFTKGWG